MSVFEQNVITTWGDNGRAWLKSLPTRISALAAQWHLVRLKPVPNLLYNYVMQGYQNSTRIILKLGCDAREIEQELTALNAYQGIGAVHVLESNGEHQALLIEHALPGTSLVSLFPQHDDDAIAYTVAVMQVLHAAPLPLAGKLPTLEYEFASLREPPPVLRSHYHIAHAQDMLNHLLSTQPAAVVLHGDLHHGNILHSERGLLAIDPKGRIGDPAYEVYAFIRNPQPEGLKSRALVMHRIALFAQHLALDKQRIHQWVYVHTVLEACWAVTDGTKDPAQAFRQAEIVRYR